MRKLLLLILLIPVLSWGDCPPPFPLGYSVNSNGERIEFTREENEYEAKLHCEAHRCFKLNKVSASCMCENLGGEITTPPLPDENSFGCNDSRAIFGKSVFRFMSEVKNKKPHYSEKPITPTPATTTTKVTIDDAKSQCTDIGFKKGTERFGECVLELMQ